MLDTRLKNNKRALYTAAVIVAFAAACFALLVLNYQDRIEDYYGEYSSELESEAFIKVLLHSNYVLYPEVLEKSGKNVRVEDLYLSFEKESISKVYIEEYIGNEVVYEGSSEQLIVEQAAELHNNLLRNDSLYTNEISMRLDYCAIDEDTQTVLKNTTRNIEQLKTGDNQEYVYYFIVCYDQNGVISNIKVSDSKEESFLKNAQLVANSTNSLLLDEQQRETHYVLVNDSDYAVEKMTVTQKNPQNATFIYAMTAEQMEGFSWFPIYQAGEGTVVWHYINNDSRELMYDRIGMGRDYLLFLAAITWVAFILARRMPQRTADTAGTRHSAELIFCIQWIIALFLYPIVIRLAYTVNEVLPMIIEMKFWVLFSTMFLLFGLWYWCLLSIRDIFSGPRAFFKKRSLIYRYWDQIKRFFQKIRDKWKSDLSSLDLGKDTTRFLKRIVTVQFVIVSVICCCWVFGIFVMIIYSVLLYLGLKHFIGKIQKQYKNLMQATNAIAQGKFDNTFEGDFGIFESYKSELYKIQGGFRTAVEEEVKSQRMKTDLITNVSHDLKTPLTAIITYIDLLKEEHITNEQRKSYLETLERKSLRLKVLIEDLFEISKASSGNVKLEPVSMDICNLMRQVYLEHEDQMKVNGLDIRFDVPEEKIILQLDSQKTYRIFENLYVNVTKYAMPNTRVYIQAKVITEEGNNPVKKVHIELKNISAQELTVNPTDLTERFVRGDVSRNTEGSGLGLAIAKSFTELQGGRFGIEIDGDLFKAVIEWDV